MAVGQKTELLKTQTVLLHVKLFAFHTSAHQKALVSL